MLRMVLLIMDTQFCLSQESENVLTQRGQEPIILNGDFNLPLCLTNFCVKSRTCGVGLTNLPYISPSITCCTRFLDLRSLRHPNLARYVDVLARKPSRIFVVSEYYNRSLASLPTPVTDLCWLSRRLAECLSALQYLSTHSIVHSTLNPSSILIDPNDSIKISGYGLYYASLSGLLVEFPLADPIYSAPEVFLDSPLLQSAATSDQIALVTLLDEKRASNRSLSNSADMWSLGLIFFELLLGKETANPLHQTYSKTTTPSTQVSVNPFGTIRVLLEGLSQCWEQYATFPEYFTVYPNNFTEALGFDELDSSLRKCLRFQASTRPLPNELMPCIERIVEITKGDTGSRNSLYTNQRFSISTVSEQTCQVDQKVTRFLASVQDIGELYHYWSLAGGNIDSTWRDGHQQQTDQVPLPSRNNNEQQSSSWLHDSLYLPAIIKLPCLIGQFNCSLTDLQVCKNYWPDGCAPNLTGFDPTVITLPSKRLLTRLQAIPCNAMFPLLVNWKPTSSDNNTQYPPSLTDRLAHQHHQQSTEYQSDLDHQPLSVKQTNIEYQIHRIAIFKRLLRGYPMTKSRLRIEVRKDIPPYLRPEIWSALLGVYGDYRLEQRIGKALAKFSVPSSKLAELEIPRQLEEEASAPSPLPDDSHGGDVGDPPLIDEPTINQINLDLPRCHSYDPLLTSFKGRDKLRRSLFVLLNLNASRIEYVQGMDSVTAVFVRLFYPNEIKAIACLQAFLSSKIPDFFAPWQSNCPSNLHAYFALLLPLFAFHQPRLACHLIESNVELVGLTTGWIYTLFSHTVPLDKTELLWDTIVAAPSSLSLFIYIALFTLLDYQVNLESYDMEKIYLVVSNFPDFDLDKCLAMALRLACATPTSLLTLHSFTNSSVDDDGQQQTASLDPEIEGLNFYKQMSRPNPWPEHLDSIHFRSELSKSIDFPRLVSKASDSQSLVPFISAADAVEHFYRPDCLVLDIRPEAERDLCYIPGSVHRPRESLTRLLGLKTNTADSINNMPSSPHPSLHETCDSSGDDDNEGGWDVIGDTPTVAHKPAILTTFIAQLMSESAWIAATDANFSLAFAVPGAATTNKLHLSPGLIIVLDSCLPESRDDQIASSVAIRLTDWLIRQHVPRVCVLFGGMAAVRRLPNCDKSAVLYNKK